MIPTNSRRAKPSPRQRQLSKRALSFSVTKDNTIDLTALYRKHFYMERTLGNFLGLGYLMGFVARETKLGVGTLLCISNVAQLDTKTNCWGKTDVKALVADCRLAFQPVST